MNWAETSLGNVCELYQPQTITTKDLLADGKYPVYGANGVIGRFDKYNHEESQLLVTCRGATCGSVNVSEPFSWINGNAMVVKPKIKELDVRFVEYFFRGAVDLTKAITGAAQPQITRQSLSPIKFNYPSLATQQKIVEKLDAIFAEIDRATVATEANVKNAELLYRTSVNQVFETFKEKEVKLKNISSINYGYTAKSSLENDGYHYLRITDIQEDFVEWINVPKVDVATSEIRKYILKDGDIVFARTGATTGKSYLVKDAPNAIFASYLIRVDVNRGEILPAYIKHYFNSEEYWNNVNAGISGAAQGGFNASKLGELLIPYVSLERQNLVVKELSTLERTVNEMKNNYFTKLTELNMLRNSILKQAFNGELVKE